MSYATKDGAWVSATRVVRMECSKCGVVTTTRWAMNDHEIEELIRDHCHEVHGGIDRGA